MVQSNIFNLHLSDKLFGNHDVKRGTLKGNFQSSSDDKSNSSSSWNRDGGAVKPGACEAKPIGKVRYILSLRRTMR